MNAKKIIRSSIGLGVVIALTACTLFTRIQGDADTLPKLNGDWLVKYVAGKPLAPMAKEPQMVFDTAHGTISGFDGCNPIRGSYTFEGGRLKAKIASGRLACTSDAAKQASAAINDLLTNGAEVVETALMKGHVLMLRNGTAEIRLAPTAAFVK